MKMKCWVIIEVNVLSKPSTFSRLRLLPGICAYFLKPWSVPKYTSGCFTLQLECFRLGFKQYTLQAYFIICLVVSH